MFFFIFVFFSFFLQRQLEEYAIMDLGDEDFSVKQIGKMVVTLSQLQSLAPEALWSPHRAKNQSRPWLLSDVSFFFL